MGRTTCRANKLRLVPRRGRSSIEWKKDGKPQYYCYGWKDSMTDEPLEVCQECPDFVDKAQEDFEKWRMENER